MTEIIRINPTDPEINRVIRAAKVIREGGTVAFPTETVYGLGANGFDPAACRRIFEIKGRPADNPLILHILGPGWLDRVAGEVGGRAMEFAEKAWPGPITLVLKKNAKVPGVVTAGLDTVAIRCPAHRIALELIEYSGVPIAAPSANLSTKPSTTRFEHVVDDLDGKVDVIIDGGDATFGVESTIINMTVEPPVLLRPGAFTVEELEKHLGRIMVPEAVNRTATDGEVAIAPGMKYRHYAPDKMLVLANDSTILRGAAMMAADMDDPIAILCSSETANSLMKSIKLRNISVIILGSEGNLYEVARNLFDAFRALDETSAKMGIVQKFDDKGIGMAIMNRISKATGNSAIEKLGDLKGMLEAQ
jgi:L-threonylcarbamoyladenylate synthase